MPLCLYFIDVQKAYDSIDRSLLWKIFARYEVPSRMIVVIRQFYDGIRVCVQNNIRECLEEFHVRRRSAKVA